MKKVLRGRYGDFLIGTQGLSFIFGFKIVTYKEEDHTEDEHDEDGTTHVLILSCLSETTFTLQQNRDVFLFDLVRVYLKLYNIHKMGSELLRKSST